MSKIDVNVDEQKQVTELLIEILDKLEGMEERLDRLDEAISNISLPTSGYNVFET